MANTGNLELDNKLNKAITELNTKFTVQMKAAFFDKLHADFKETPPKTEHISVCIKELADGLCKFIPSRLNIHTKIKNEIIFEEVNIQTMPCIIDGLIKWIELFQAPVYDTKTKKWREDFKNCSDYADFLRDFFKEYYEHIEVVYKEVWEARKRLINGENVVPLEHRPIIQGTNGVPNIMRTGGK